MTPTYTVTDTKTKEIILDHVPCVEVLKHLNIKEKTLRSLIPFNGRLCRRRYLIQRDYQEADSHFSLSFVLDFSARWREMQAIWGINTEESQ